MNDTHKNDTNSTLNTMDNRHNEDIPNRCIIRGAEYESLKEDVVELKDNFKTMSNRFDSFSGVVTKIDTVIENLAKDREELREDRNSDRLERTKERKEQEAMNQATLLTLQKIGDSLSVVKQDVSALTDDVEEVKKRGTINWIDLCGAIIKKTFITLGGAGLLYFLYVAITKTMAM